VHINSTPHFVMLSQVTEMRVKTRSGAHTMSLRITVLRFDLLGKSILTSSLPIALKVHPSIILIG
jgi:hypothetical protein